MASISLKNIQKIYPGKIVAVDNFNLDIADKEFIVLVGPSGCGKSTTLRMIAGLEEITAGNLYIGDKLVNDTPPKDRDIAMVFQNYALYPHMTVYKNMAFALTLRKIPKQEIKARITQAAKALDIEHLLARKPKALSGGQRQRVALGRAMVRNPAVFLLDEPLSNLDAKLRNSMRTELIQLHQRLGTTFVYVTHDQTEAMTMGDRIVVMKDGFIQQVDTPQKLYDAPKNKFVAGFIGSPQMNFINGILSHSADTYALDIQGDLLPIPKEKTSPSMADYIGKTVTLGIRPEDIYADNSLAQHSVAVTIQTKVTVRELMGSEVYLYLQYKDMPLTARVSPSASAALGTTLQTTIDMSKAHLFSTQEDAALLSKYAIHEYTSL